MVKNREDKSVQKACTKRFLYQKLDGLMTALLMQHSIYALQYSWAAKYLIGLQFDV